MNVITTEQLREQARRAKEAFVAVGGKLPEQSSPRDFSAPTCGDLLAVSSVCWWFAGQATLMGLGPEYAAYYTGLADAFDAVAAAQGC